MTTTHLPSLPEAPRAAQTRVRASAHRPQTKPQAKPAGSQPPSWEELLGRR